MSHTPDRASAAEADSIETTAGLVAIESRIRAEWEAMGLQRELCRRRAVPGTDGGSFVMYDGLSSPYGAPHFGHLLSGYVKDTIQRYRTMRGDQVRHRYAWDCHIQPIEGEVEAALGITRKQAAAKIGIDNFMAASAEAVDAHTEDYRRLWFAQARSTDFDDDIRTYRMPYMESVLWAFAELWHRGYIRRGNKVLDYCWNCEAPLSQREITESPSAWRKQTQLTLAVTLLDGPEPGAAALATVAEPWLLLGQAALGVRRDARYLAVTAASGPLAGRRLILAEDRFDRFRNEIGVGRADAAATAGCRPRTLTGADLLGVRYQSPAALTRQQGHGVVVHAPHALQGRSTGVIVMAPAYSTADWEAAMAAGVPEREPVADLRAMIGEQSPGYARSHLLEVSPLILKDLTAGTGTAVIRTETRRNAVTLCLRCGAELIQFPVPAWFVRVEDAVPKMQELAHKIRWLPGPAVEEAFMRWIGNAHDWCISRNRYWGTPIPVWVSDDPSHPRSDVYGSTAELERDFGVRPADLHRATLDRLTRPNPDDPSGVATMRRVPEVFSCWFESGSLPFAELHYPFENVPYSAPPPSGDLVVESATQVQGWFFALHAMSTLLFGRPAFWTCIGHGMLLGSDGRKMSVAAGNHLDVWQVLRHQGTDAVRWYLLTSAVLRGEDIQVVADGIRDTSRQTLIPLLRAYEYWSTCAHGHAGGSGRRENDDPASLTAADEAALLDRYIAALVRNLAADVGRLLDVYDITGACQQVRLFAETLTKFYLRRSRTRLGAGDRTALATLQTVLEMLSRIVAPLAPVLSEEIWRGITGGRSVHLAAWPEPEDTPDDAPLVARMAAVRSICKAARGIRRSCGIRLRQPLAELVIAGQEAEDLAPFARIVELEVNVRCVRFENGASTIMILRPLPRLLGPRLGAACQRVLSEAKAGSFVVNDDGTATVAGEILAADEFELLWQASSSDGAVVDDRWVIALDTTITPELDADGFIQDVLHLIREERKAAGLDSRQSVPARLYVPPDRRPLLTAHASQIALETRTSSLEIVSSDTHRLQVRLSPP